MLLCGCVTGKGREQGAEGGRCLEGDTCNAGLTCVHGWCVLLPEAGLCLRDAASCKKCNDASPCKKCNDAGGGTCPDAAPCKTCNDAAPACKDAAPACKDAAPCKKCSDAGPAPTCKDAAPCPACKDAAPCPTCKDAAPCPACKDCGASTPVDQSISGDGPVQCPLNGSYSINPKASGNRNFVTFKGAISTLKKCGVSGHVTFNAAAGTHKEKGFSFPAVSSASATRTITFRAAPGAKVKLEGCTGTYIIHIEAKAHHLTLDGFEMDGTAKANKITNYYSGPVVFSKSGGQQDITLRRLEIHDFGPAAWQASLYLGCVYMQVSKPIKNIHIDRCIFKNIEPASSFHTQGAISLRNETRDNLRITGCAFINIGKMDAINLRGGTFTNLLIANNVFVMPKGYGVELFNGPTMSGSNNRFVHNTIVAAKNGYGVKGSATGKLTVKNNIFLGPAGATPSFISTNAATASHSCLYNAKAGYTTTSSDVLADPKLVSLTAPYDLHLQSGSPCIDKAVPVAGVLTDMEGDPRGSLPDIGADEWKP